MKKQLILSLLVVFVLGVFAPAVVNAMDNQVVIVKVDGEEKKADTKKAEKKAGDCAAKSETKTSTCADKAEKKSSCDGEKKADCGAKTEKK